MTLLTGKRILITGGTGSLGKVLLRRILTEELGRPAKITIFSRDEGKQHALRVAYMNRKAATEEIIYNNFNNLIDFRIGDVRNLASIAGAMRHADIVINTAALKQVPSCEYFPMEAVKTNIEGAQNIAQAIRDYNLNIETVVCISTDKAVAPVNVMGMSKALQERIFLTANLDTPQTRFIAVRYGNVLASRGSVIPLFHEQIKSGQNITITHTDMTRFLLSLDQAVNVIFAAMKDAHPGETYIPIIPAAKVTDIAKVLIGNRPTKIEITGIRPGEKLHEALISEEEGRRAFRRGDYYVIPSILPELQSPQTETHEVRGRTYTSNDDVMAIDEVESVLKRNALLLESADIASEAELIR